MKKEKNEIKFLRKDNIEIIQGDSSHSFPMHSHSSFCIGIVTDGKILLKLDTREYELGKNNVYFIPPHIEHTIAAIDNKRYSYQVTCIGSLSKKKEYVPSFKKLVFLDESIGEKLMKKYQNFNITHDYRQLKIDMIQFIKENTSLSLSNRVNNKRDIELISFLTAYIQEHLDEPFNLQKLCDFAHITKFHLIRVFKRHMGAAPHQFYLQEKIRKIKQGLSEQQPTVNLAYYLNFTDQSHLCNTFKKYVGLTPSQFSKSYINK